MRGCAPWRPNRAPGRALAGDLDLARESVALHRTTVNTAQLASLLELQGDLAGALEEWERVEAAEPARRADVRRCAERIAARAGDVALLRAAVGTGRAARERARAAGDTARTELWSGVLQRLLTPWIEGAAARQDWLAAMSGCALLQEVAPADPLLARYRIPALEGGLRTLRAQGRTAEARGVRRSSGASIPPARSRPRCSGISPRFGPRRAPPAVGAAGAHFELS
jgi:hypothetical protein